MNRDEERARALVNRQLFSNHFLENRLRADPLWVEVGSEATRIREELRALLDRQQGALAESNESQTEERWIKPTLRALGWGFEVQPRSARLGTVRFPDYALFDSPAEATAAASEEHRQVLRRAIGVLEAKRWRRDLDARGSGMDEDPNRVPSVQIINYLFRSSQPWGVLTNGAEWRLYCRDAEFADTAYLAVDLPALLGNAPLSLGETGELVEPAEAFRYFYLFFRPGAFEPDPAGRRWLDLARESSTRYAEAVEEALKPRAYRAITALCRGFLVGDGAAPEELVEDAARRQEILDNSLTLLFRLLFLLYAESRDLLPVRTNPTYRRKSLLRLRERAATVRDGKEALFPRGKDFWNDQADLFGIVDGDPHWSAVGVPVYDGGLFDPERHPWLEEHYVADPQMAEALDLLSRTEDPDTGALHFIDYSPLDVRHLGSVYEGLLEHVVRVAERDLPAVREKGEVIRDPVRAGDLYLATDRGERKASGSYYTPDYIVQYIVDGTLGPLVEGRTAREILGLRVLDPAMGSGHFLVAATSYLARAAVSAAEAANQPVLGDFAHLDPEHLRRLVVERCIFGVDKNPRAVELAKLSLWLATVQKGKPLNFLDHHLKCGDSLLGARVRDLSALPGRKEKDRALEAAGQYNPFDAAFRQRLIRTLGFFHLIDELLSDTVENVERKEALYAEADATLDRFREVGHVWASALLGNGVKGDDYSRALQALQEPRERWETLRAQAWFQRALEMARAYRFFHWDIEFGGVFFDEEGREREDAGFDAVIGNPPYVRMEGFKQIKDFLRHAYRTHATRSDLYVYFAERSLDLLREGGEYGAIVSNKFLRANYGKGLRKLLGDRAGVREIVDFGGLPVFPDATVRAAIVLAERGDGEPTPRVTEIGTLEFVRLADEVDRGAFRVDPRQLRGEEWLLVPPEVARLLEKMERAGSPLGSVVDGRICYGIKTGLNEAFFIDRHTRRRLVREDPRSEEVIRPLVVGSQLHPYWIEPIGRWLLYLPHGVEISRYPAVERHLEPFRERLEGRATKQAWYELQQPQEAYREFFERPKTVYPIIARDVRFAFDPTFRFPNDKCFCIPGERWWLLAVLNARTTFFWLDQVAARLEGRSRADRYLEFRAQYMERLPVPEIPETTPPRPREELGRWLRSLYHRGLRKAGVEPDVPEDIRSLGPRIGALEGVERVLLVGSWARGDTHEESDIDLLVIRARNKRETDGWREVRERIGAFGRPVHVVVLTPGQYRRRSGVSGSYSATTEAEAVVLYPDA